ncbi:MAG: hypothetical protein HQM10_05590 [Candidatus Riflebacteria bacterium]|nr:hypothetical protein [Candidatus Riflebacteria bacterium]
MKNVAVLNKIWVLMLVLVSVCTIAHSAPLNLFYEKAIYDYYGNQIGSQKYQITSVNDLPVGSPWRDYLNQPVGNKTLLGYTLDVSSSLALPLNLTISDKNSISTSSKNTSGYNITLYKHVTQYTTPESKKFIFLHELGHVAMLNAYPSSYNFSGLDYGSDNAHYMDEILPNNKTAWVEGWANAFAANKNNGMIFSLNINDNSVLNFLQAKSFEEMSRNELFNAKVINDLFQNGGDGKTKVFNSITYSGPHNSLKDFCKGYLSMYPQDQVRLAQILDSNSKGKISQSELLNYVNNGSNVVNQDMYNYINSRANSGGTGSNGSVFSGSFWTSIKSFFSRVFKNIFSFDEDFAGLSPSSQPSESTTGMNSTLSANYADGDGVTTIAPSETKFMTLDDSKNNQSPLLDTPVTGAGQDMISAEEEYFEAFKAYNKALGENSVDSPAVKAALDRLKKAKERSKTGRKSIK